MDETRATHPIECPAAGGPRGRLALARGTPAPPPPDASPVTLDFLKPVIGPGMAEVDQALRESLASDVALIRQVADYIIGGGGKRLRPALLLLTAGATGYSGREHYLLAAVLEMIHTATLLHDDVVDESSLRRGRATANATFGNATAVLVGDFLHSRAFQLLVGVGRAPVLRIVSDATNVIAEGEVLQLMSSGRANVDESAYLEVIQRKTAKLFEAAARLGAVLGDATPEREDAFARYGMHLGTAFQIMDDVLDYSGDATAIGKNLGDDLAEGKMTLPLIRAIQRGSAEDAATIRHAVEGGGRLTDFRPVVDVLQRTGALAYARDRAAEQGRLARACLDGLAPSPYARNLLDLASFAADRAY
ncbi:MAG: octaprenyl diphosphate synthase [Betaproteobacteria bacterium]|nr:MAG: octaprenyl diphosphate synthase [Betaproteobacteria bacterium]